MSIRTIDAWLSVVVMTKFAGRVVGFRNRELLMKTLNRRDAIKVVVGASAALYTGCTRGEPPMTKLAEVQGLVPLPAGATPWPTRDPFLFCVHHLDSIRRATQSVDPRHRLPVARLGKTLPVSMVGECIMVHRAGVSESPASRIRNGDGGAPRPTRSRRFNGGGSPLRRG